MGVIEEKKKLEKVLASRYRAEKWIKLGIRQIKFEDLKYAIDNNIFVDTLLFNHFSPWMYNKILKPIIQLIFRVNWELAEGILTDVHKLHRILTENRPEFAKLLSTPKAIKWLNKCTERGYKKIYSYVWLE